MLPFQHTEVRHLTTVIPAPLRPLINSPSTALILSSYFLLPPATKLGQDNIFTSVILFTGGGGLPQCMLGYQPPPPLDQAGTSLSRPGRYPPPDQAPPRRTRHPPWDQAPLPGARQAPPPPPSRAYWEIRSTSGRYASYWNAILY